MLRIAHFVGGGKFSHFKPLVGLYPLISRCQNKTSHGQSNRMAAELARYHQFANAFRLNPRDHFSDDGRSPRSITPRRSRLSAKQTSPTDVAASSAIQS